MIFKRKILEELKEWKELDDGRTALLIEGARRVGKTTVSVEFARTEYKSFIIIDFSEMNEDLMDLFTNHASDLDVFFRRLQLSFGVKLHERKSVIIFDEVQMFPRARQMIKSLVRDRRYDYIETGSLISLRKNVIDIRIPSEEHVIEMHPMDFEEWMWANGKETTYEMLKTSFESRMPLGLHAHKALMEEFRTYMVVGGMPQAVDRFVETNDYMSAERVKNDILKLYESDIMKLPDKARNQAYSLLHSIPANLSSQKKTFSPGRIMKGARSRSFTWAIDWFIKAKIINPCFLCNDPDTAMALTRDASRLKLYFLDTGLLMTLAFGSDKKMLEEAYRNLIAGRLSINEGMFFENVVAQQLAVRNCELYFHEFRDGESQLYEIDFIIPDARGIIPVEVKSSVSSKHRSLDLFMKKYRTRIEQTYVVHAKDLREDGGITYIPVYMTGLLRRFRYRAEADHRRHLSVHNACCSA